MIKDKILFSKSLNLSVSTVYLIREPNALQAVLLLELLVFLDEGVDPVYHALDQLNLGVTQAVLVGDVIGNTCNETSFKGGVSKIIMR